MTWTDPHATWQRLNEATAELDPPLAILDLDAFDRNRIDIARRAGGKPVRVASKSLRVRRAIGQILTHQEFAGVLAYTLPEALWLATASEVWEPLTDVVVGYPSVDRAAIAQLAADPQLCRYVTVMVDDVAHLDALNEACKRTGTRIRVCIDIDSSWRPQMPGKASIHVGARRSPIHELDQTISLVREILVRPGLSLVGLMFYESQIAGVGDKPPHQRVRGQLISLMQTASGADLAKRRPAIVSAVRNELADRNRPELEFVNAGGTGSLELSSADPSVTEVTAGSGFFGPTLFDTYRHFHPEPASAFALPIVRRPGPGIVTVLGGGYIASGAHGPSRLPTPWLPEGLKLDPQEGAGEVQTPLKGKPADTLGIGDRVWLRHAKAGELAEHFNEIHLVRGYETTQAVPTYRGEGRCFL